MARMITRQEAATLLNVSGQTISNWVEKGILNAHYSCDSKNTILIDRKSIEKYFDSLEELAFMEKRITLQKKTLRGVTNNLEKELEDMTKAKHLFGKGVSEFFLRDIFNCVLHVTGDELLKEREKDILKKLMSGLTLKDVAECYCLTPSRILQITNKAISKIYTMKSWPQMHEEYKRVSAENQRITAMLESQRLRTKELEAQLGMKETIGDGMSLVPGYTKVQLAKTLATPLANCNLTVRTLNCMKATDIETVGDLVKYTKVDLLKLRNLGKKSLRELDELLDSMNLTFGMDVERIIDAQIEAFLKENQNKC